MRRRLAYLLAPAAVLALSLASMQGCKQAEGEKCQVDSDCDTSVDVCNEGTGLCQPKNAAQDAAPIVPDAKVDAGPVDASFDASVDGMPDA
jgi:hypothetical protein